MAQVTGQTFKGMRTPFFNTDTRLEPIGDIIIPPGLLTAAEYRLPSQNGNLPMNRFIEGLDLMVQMRLTNAVAAETAINVDAPYSIINRVVVEGRHRIRNANETFIDLRGPDLWHLMKFYQGCDGFDQSTTPLGIVLNNTNDILFNLHIPFIPLLLPRFLSAGYLLDAPNYDQLTLRVFLGDLNSLFTTGVGSTETVGPYLGNAAYPARIRVSGYFAQAGASFFKGFVPGRVWRYQNELTGGAMTTTANGTRLFNVPKGNRLRNVMLKTGVKAVTTPGCDAFLTVSDFILTNIRMNRGLNKPIRQYNDFFTAHAEEVYLKHLSQAGAAGAAAAPAVIYPLTNGYMLMDWCPKGSLDDILDLRGLVAGATGDVDTYIDANVVGAAGQAAVAVWEEIRGYPMFYAG
jgi:hypothetical protein